ncbi:RNA polymerase sigma factor [Jiulongibacter sp. NS-SX5]|uniref:RNA polymerase sigma factor n=1 Tax=Jiulongibacter sp. NS-SX5 TaxID=3463854 RepID=UPI004059330F
MNEFQKLAEADDLALGKFYKTNRKDFLRFGARYGLPEEELLDIYQDACIVLIENARKGNLKSLKSTVKTYLFGIGKFLIFKRFKEAILQTDETPEKAFDPFEKPKIDIPLQQLGERCRAILQLFYYHEKKLDDICEELGYKDKNVLKSQKSRCIAQLRALMKRTNG